MTESEWLQFTDPTPMLEFLHGKASERKLRLFAVACCRGIWHLLTDECSKTAAKTAEMFADGIGTRDELAVARTAAEAVAGLGRTAARAAERAAVDDAAYSAWCTQRCAAWSVGKSILNRRKERAVVFDARKEQTFALRDIIGNPFRPISINPIWLTPTVSNLAQSAYEERILPSGELDPARLAVLSDALEESGCDNSNILTHLRGPGPHVRGCWILDLLLGKK